MHPYDNPLYSMETRLQVAIGAVEYRDQIIENLRSQIEAFQRYFNGEKPCYSTGICGATTCGYGKLDETGYFEFPLYLEETTI